MAEQQSGPGRDTMWAAVGTVGRAAVGTGRSPVSCAMPDADRPVLRVVPDPAPPARRGSGEDDSGSGTPSLYKLRVRLPDESGALASLTAAVAGAGGNILGLSVHGQDSRSVIDEMLVGGTIGMRRLEDVARSAVGASEPDAVLVVAADPHDLVDAPTRALDLVVQARGREGGSRDGGDDGLLQGLSALLQADEVVAVPGPPTGDDDRTLAVPSPSGSWLLARRGWAPFTVTERARAEAFLRAVAAPPRRAANEFVLPTGETLTATPAVGDEIIELDSLLRTCLAGTDPDVAPDLDWTAAQLRAVLLPPGGGCLVVRTPDGSLVGIGSALPADELDPHAGAEPVLLVHPLFRGHRLGRWMRRKLADHLAV